MKILKPTLLFIVAFFIILSTQSCKDGQCKDIVCQNGGRCEDGICVDCDPGYRGDDCGSIDLSLSLQELLDLGFTPIELLENGVSVESFYGKTYASGLIFYINTDDGTGLVAAFEDQSTGAQWGCHEMDMDALDNIHWNEGNPEGTGAEIGDGARNTDEIINASCTSTDDSDIAAKLCRDIGPEWFLPSIQELNLMHSNLLLNEYDGFDINAYWSSTENDENQAFYRFFYDSSNNSIAFKNVPGGVRAVRAF